MIGGESDWLAKLGGEIADGTVETYDDGNGKPWPSGSPSLPVRDFDQIYPARTTPVGDDAEEVEAGRHPAQATVRSRQPPDLHALVFLVSRGVRGTRIDPHDRRLVSPAHQRARKRPRDGADTAVRRGRVLVTDVTDAHGP